MNDDLEPDGVDTHQYLTFTLQGDMFALSIKSVREIIEFDRVSAVPMAPPHILGVINLRGSVVPVVDLGLRLGKEAAHVSRRTCIVIVDAHHGDGMQRMGAVVDGVSEVLEIPANAVEAPPEFGTQVALDFIQGMGKVAGRFVTLLDMDRVFSMNRNATRSNTLALPGP